MGTCLECSRKSIETGVTAILGMSWRVIGNEFAEVLWEQGDLDMKHLGDSKLGSHWSAVNKMVECSDFRCQEVL